MGERVLIFGLSPAAMALGRALRRAGARVQGHDPDARAAAQALSTGTLDEITPAELPLDPALTLVVLALPLRAVPDAIARLGAALPDRTVLVDLSPLMLPSVSAARNVPGLGARFVPSHPILETEAPDRSTGGGRVAADPIAGATVFVGAPLEPGSAAARVAEMWRSLGARPEAIAPPLHDALLALTHHLPVLAAAALARTIRRTGSLTRAVAPGARSMLADATRAVSGPAAPAAEVLALSAPKLLPALEILEREVRRLRHSLEEGGEDLTMLLEEAREFRRELVA
jgi:prephenate dehydrogenase